MRGLMVRVLRELRFPWLLRRRFFALYDAAIWARRLGFRVSHGLTQAGHG